MLPLQLFPYLPLTLLASWLWLQNRHWNSPLDQWGLKPRPCSNRPSNVRLELGKLFLVKEGRGIAKAWDLFLCEPMVVVDGKLAHGISYQNVTWPWPS